MLFPAQGSDRLVLRPSKKQQQLQGLQDGLSRAEFDANSSPSLKQNVHYERRPSSSSAVTTSILSTVERTSSDTCGEEKTTQLNRSSIALAASTTPKSAPPSHPERRFFVLQGKDDDLYDLSSPDRLSQRYMSPQPLPSNISTDRTEPAPVYVISDQQKSTGIAIANIAPTRIDPAPEEQQSTRQIYTEDVPFWYNHDARGADLGENMVFGNAPIHVYPMGLSALTPPVWFCPDPSCNRHLNARRTGPEPFQCASALREHAINEHPPRPLPSTSTLPASCINRDSEIAINTIREGFTRAESTRGTPIPAVQPIPRTASTGSIPADYIASAVVSKFPQAVPLSPASNARQREETDSLLGSDNDAHSDDAASTNTNVIIPSNHPAAEAYVSPYVTMPNSAISPRPRPPFFAERFQNPSAGAVLRPETQHGSQKRFGERACSSCKARKSKCGKEKPSCAFCLKRGSLCSYPGQGEVNSDSYDSLSESITNVTQEKPCGISSLTDRQRLGEDENEDEDDDEDEEKLLAELEAMEVQPFSKSLCCKQANPFH